MSLPRNAIERSCFLLSGLLCLFWTGCSSPLVDRSDHVSDWVEARTGYETTWNRRTAASSIIDKKIEECLQGGLTLDTTLQITLLNNPDIQAAFEEYGIAQADLVEAGLLSNPAFELFFRLPFQPHQKTNIEYTVVQSFIDLFLVPLRTKAACTQLTQTGLDIAGRIVEKVYAVEQHYYEILTLQHTLAIDRSLLSLYELVCDLSDRQYSAGNVSILMLRQAQLAVLEQSLEITRSENALAIEKEKLHQLLGGRDAIQWSLSDTAPNKHGPLPSLKDLEILALNQRLDLLSARLQCLRLQQELKTQQPWFYTRGHAGIGGERDPDGSNFLGPAFSGEIPLFNYGQADRLRTLALYHQAADILNSLEIQTLSEVRSAYAQIDRMRNVSENYAEALLPLQENLLAFSESLYHRMGIGIDELIGIKRQQLQTQKDALIAYRNLKLAEINLNRALGMHLDLHLEAMGLIASDDSSSTINMAMPSSLVSTSETFRATESLDAIKPIAPFKEKEMLE